MQQSNSSKAKYRILQVVPREATGVEYHRQVIPHTALMRYYPELFEVVQVADVDRMTDAQLKTVHLVQFNRILSNFSKQSGRTLARLRKLGVVSVCDLDDYWFLSQKHLLRKHFKDHNITAQTIECLMNSDHITVTHDLLGQMTTRDNWSVLANAIDPEQPQFHVKDYPPKVEDKIQFGWVGGTCHLEDIELVKESMSELHQTNLNYALNLCGYSAANPIYHQYEGIFTDGGNCSAERYHRIEAMDVLNYANMYDYIDVALIPLNNNLFNRCKSNLKLLEAGFKKKAVICSDIHPYSPLLRHGINGLKVNPTDNKRGWLKMIERYCKNPNMIIDHAAQLHQDVQQFHIEKWSKVRAELYTELIERRNKI